MGVTQMNTVLVETKTQKRTSFINWQDGYSVNVRELDQQHRMIILMLNELNEALERGQDQADLEKILDGFLSFSLEHFNTEEDLFEMYCYPFACTHKAEHDAFRQTISMFARQCKEGQTRVDRRFLDFCAEWLKRHIIGRDKTYAYFFAAKGLQ
jgi:hemerythrin-like metal-binding protein